MRSIVSFLMLVLSVPAILLYGLYLSIEVYGFFNAGLLSEPLFHKYPLLTSIRIFMHLSGVVAWGCLAIMGYYWCKNKTLSKKLVCLATCLALIGLYPLRHGLYTLSSQNVAVLWALPAIIWAIYLVKWHLSSKQIA